MPERPLMAIQWLFDLLATGHPPAPLWDLPADVCDEIRTVASIVMRKQK